MSTHILKRWADAYSPLSHPDEIKLSTLPDEERLELLLKHNSRALYKQLLPWTPTFGLDEAYSIATLACVKTFHTYKEQYHKKRYFFFARLRISGALHREAQRLQRKADHQVGVSQACIDSLASNSPILPLEGHSILHKAITLLQEPHRSFTTKVWLEGLTQRQALKALGETTTNCSKLNQECLEQLKAILNKYYPEESLHTLLGG